MIKTKDNCHPSKQSPELDKAAAKKIGNRLQLTIDDYISKKNDSNVLFSFFSNPKKQASKNADGLIIDVQKCDAGFSVQTGNYVGKLTWEGLEIRIDSRFGRKFLERMLNFANDIFLDDVQLFGNLSKEFDLSKFIIYYLFVQKLEKSFLLGLPKTYQNVRHHDLKLKGKIDINRLIKHDIPFLGKLSSVGREQQEVQEVIDVLYKAIKVVENSGINITQNISKIKTHLKQHKSNSLVSNKLINQALSSKALANPIFAPYKMVIEYAKLIINGDNIEERQKGKKSTFGFLINVAELFEIYVTKLLKRHFPDWIVDSPKIELYKGLFYERFIIPDIVMTKETDVIVFDTKYKRMNFTGKNIYGSGDLDRNDFFQINTYMSHYQNHGELNLKLGGLLYPIETKLDSEKCHSPAWFGNDKTKFIVDGIELAGLKDDGDIIEDIKGREIDFINRIKKLIKAA